MRSAAESTGATTGRFTPGKAPSEYSLVSGSPVPAGPPSGGLASGLDIIQRDERVICAPAFPLHTCQVLRPARKRFGRPLDWQDQRDRQQPDFDAACSVESSQTPTGRDTGRPV